AEDGIRDATVTGVQTCALPIFAVSNFVHSFEFQQTGYLVERMYKVAYGDAAGASTFGGAHPLAVPIVRFKEFLRDTQEIGLGVEIGRASCRERGELGVGVGRL